MKPRRSRVLNTLEMLDMLVHLTHSTLSTFSQPLTLSRHSKHSKPSTLLTIPPPLILLCRYSRRTRQSCCSRFIVKAVSGIKYRSKQLIVLFRASCESITTASSFSSPLSEFSVSLNGAGLSVARRVRRSGEPVGVSYQRISSETLFTDQIMIWQS